MQVYDPRGVVAAQQRSVSKRMNDVKGLRLGVLDNTKWNANKLLRALRDELESRHGVKATGYYRKESFSKYAEPTLVARIVAENDIVLTAIGD